jgi:hypothetical protein
LGLFLMLMNGISYVTNSEGQRTHVLIDLSLAAHLEVNGLSLADFFDHLAYQARKSEPKVSLAEMKRRLAERKKLGKDV